MKNFRSVLLTLILAGLIFVVGAFIFAASSKKAAITNLVGISNGIDNSINILNTKLVESKRTSKLLVAGDTMLAEHVGGYIVNEGLDPFHYLQDFFSNYNAIVVNLECNLSNKETGSPQNKPYTFKAPVEALDVLANANITAVNVANNHSMDYGPDAFTEELELLKSKNILPFGGGINQDAAFEPIYIELDEAKVAFIGVNAIETIFQNSGPNSAGSAFFNETYIKNAIDEAKENSDFVIIMPHWGQEHTLHSNTFQQSWGHKFIDMGVDMVVGMHVHVRQEVEEYKGKMIYYSLGNFVFSGMGWNPEAILGSMIELEFKDGKLVNTERHEIDIVYHGFPKFYWQEY